MINDHPYLCATLAIFFAGAAATSELVCLACCLAGYSVILALLIADRRLYS